MDFSSGRGWPCSQEPIPRLPPLINTGALRTTPRHKAGTIARTTESGTWRWIMFEHSLIDLEAKPSSRRRWLSLPIAVGLHVAGLTAFALASYWNVGTVPDPQLADVFIVTLPPPDGGGGGPKPKPQPEQKKQ